MNVINKFKDSNDKISSDPAIIANVSHSIARNIPKSNKSPLDFLVSRNGNSFFIAPCVSLEIINIISFLKPGNSET